MESITDKVFGFFCVCSAILLIFLDFCFRSALNLTNIELISCVKLRLRGQPFGNGNSKLLKCGYNSEITS